MNRPIFHLVTNDSRPMNRLRVARAHIEVAIAHINNEAQTRVPSRRGGHHSETDALRVLVQALADIRDELTDTRQQTPNRAEFVVEGLGWR